MKLTLFNSLTRRKEIFVPLSDDFVNMYVCGPTVYDRPHVGNARSVVCYDLLYRVLRCIYGEKHVQYVRNITDIDDKIIDRAKDRGVKIRDLTIETTQMFHSDMDYLKCLRPNHEPRATEHIKGIINIIQLLLDKGIAYKSSDHVYFSVTEYQDYAKLSNQSLNDLLNSVRIDQSNGKKHHADFVLWKPAKETEDEFNTFDSPFGRGRPGWHIECSAMSNHFFGENFDIHGGGIDLVFPHHTNEIAQSCCAFPGSDYAKIWVHNGFLTINKEKMSKSLGNFLTVKDLVDQKIPGEVIRLFLISAHYRKPLDYNEKAVQDSYSMLNYWYRAMDDQSSLVELPQEFLQALFDDLNTHKAITIINSYAKKVYLKEREQESRDVLYSCAQFLGLLNSSTEKWFSQNINIDLVNGLIKERSEAKNNKDWAKADAIRSKLSDQGISIEDTPDGSTIWKKI